MSDRCASCGGGTAVRVDLDERGPIWTWTVQRFAPKAPYESPPEGFAPFAVGYVDLGDVFIESVIVGEVDTLEIGQAVHLVRHPISGAEGDWSFAFSA